MGSISASSSASVAPPAFCTRWPLACCAAAPARTSAAALLSPRTAAAARCAAALPLSLACSLACAAAAACCAAKLLLLASPCLPGPVAEPAEEELSSSKSLRHENGDSVQPHAAGCESAAADSGGMSIDSSACPSSTAGSASGMVAARAAAAAVELAGAAAAAAVCGCSTAVCAAASAKSPFELGEHTVGSLLGVEDEEESAPALMPWKGERKSELLLTCVEKARGGGECTYE